MSTLSITTIQSTLHWEDKGANLKMFSEKINALPEGAEIVVLPEMFTTGFTMRPQKLAEKMEGPSMQWMHELAERKRIILCGSMIIEDEGHFYNRLIWMLPNGKFGYYDKRHLFGFAGEDEHYTAGHKRLITSVKGWKINLMICYDLRFPIWSRQSNLPLADAAPEFDVLIYVANWPERRNLAWKTLLQARAIENQTFVVGVNRVGADGNGINHSGDSMIIDPLGELLYHQKDIEEVATLLLQKEKLDESRRKFPFWKDADHFTITD